MAGMIGGFAAVLLVKGIFAVMVPLVCGLWLVARGRSPRPWPAWLGVVVMPLVGVLLASAYDAAYYRVTGQSFLEIYRRNQMPDAAYAGSLLWRTAYNAAWYCTRVVWYSAPWSIPALLMAAREVWTGEWRPWTRRAAAGDGAARQGAWFAIAAGLALEAGFSFAHRKADRYIFPAYFLVGAAGAAATIQWSPWLARLVDRLDRPWVPPAIYLGLVLLTLATSGKLPVFTYWRT